MKIILASKEKFLLSRAYDLLGLSRSELKIGLVNTAFKAVQDRDYIRYMDEYYRLMSDSGLDFQPFDIEGRTEVEILKFFADRNVVQVSGGNPFYLLKAIRAAGFDRILPQLLDRGLNYIGCSSGSYIMCPTVEVGSWKAGRDRYGLTDWTALNYVPFLIKCHYRDDEKDCLTVKAKNLQYPLRVLKDDQCFVLEDGRTIFVGDSEEIFL